jgi:hypothetical protein
VRRSFRRYLMSCRCRDANVSLLQGCEDFMTTAPLNVLKHVAKRVRKRIARCNLYDPNVCKSDFLPTKPWMTRWLPGDLFEHQVRFKRRGHQITMRANAEYVLVELRGAASVRGVVFSVNLLDRIMVTKRLLLRLGPKAWPVFICRDDSSDTVAQWFKVSEHARFIEQLGLEDGEGLVVCANALRAYLKCPSQDRLMSFPETLTRIVEELPSEKSEPMDSSELPAQFHGLQPLIRLWAIADDADRSERVKRASVKILRHFVDTVYLQLDAIDTYLHSFGDNPLSEAAAALGTLAECACEAKLRLDRVKRR